MFLDPTDKRVNGSSTVNHFSSPLKAGLLDYIHSRCAGRFFQGPQILDVLEA